jgi:HEAT repeat protein
MRRAAAEALVNNREEGVPTLEEGLTVDDLLVRRSVVFAFMRLNQPEFFAAIEKMAVEDGQWVVRNAAAHALEVMRQPNPYIPRRSPVVTEIPWLISFAGKQGMGVQPGKPAMDLILKAVENGDEHEKLSALEYLRLFGSDYAIHRLYNAYFGSLENLREAAYNTIWHIAASGVTLPPPAQFGLGKL